MLRRIAFLSACSLLVACSSSSGDTTPQGETGVPGDSTADLGTDSPGDAGCTPPLDDPHAGDRTSCKFAAGAKVSDTIGDMSAVKQKIGHVIVMMKENRSFDMMLGELSKTMSAVEPTPSDFSNPDPSGASVQRFHQTNSCVPNDPDHQWDNQHADWDNGKNDGFVKNAAAHSTPASDGKFVMGYYDQTDLPFYYWLASHYAVADHYFCSALSGTWSNRLFLYAGSSYGVKVTGSDTAPATINGHTLLDALIAAGVTVGVYSDDAFPLDGALLVNGWAGDNKNVHPTKDFFDGLKSGSLPQVVFVDSLENKEDEHPPGDVQLGEQWSKKVYDAVTSSSIWLGSDGKATALFYTYDENGSFADHVPPPTACAPSSDLSDWDHLGFRVPFVLVSPYAKKAFVSKTVHSHTSITRFLEGLYDLPAITARDANSDALLDMFDFGCASSTPTGAPSAGTGECAIGSGDAGTDGGSDASSDAPSDGG